MCLVFRITQYEGGMNAPTGYERDGVQESHAMTGKEGRENPTAEKESGLR